MIPDNKRKEDNKVILAVATRVKLTEINIDISQVQLNSLLQQKG
jgi:hypothetical protein